MMVTRICTKRIGVLLRPASSCQYNCRRDAGTAAALVGQISNLPHATQQAIFKATTVKNPDPQADSQTARLVDDQKPFMVPTYVRPGVVFERGEGCYMWDIENRKYLDFTAGIAVNALGHGDLEIANIMYNQARTLIHSCNLYHNPWTGALSKLLIESTKSSGAMRTASKSFICNSGSEANEAAIKFARKVGKTYAPDMTDFVSFHGSFHGRTMGSLSATPNSKYQEPFAPMLPGFRYGTYNDVAAVDELITDKTCGVIVEPVQGEGGVNVATPEFLAALRRRCDEVNAVLIFDEIQCGLSRTGVLWAHSSQNAHPDVLCTAKALGNGFPIGATIVNEHVASKIVTGDHGTTFGGNPLGCRLAHHIVSRLSDPNLQAGVLRKEKIFRKHFGRLQHRFPDQVGEVRGRGLMLGLQLTTDPTAIITAARERGLLVITCGTNTLRFVPPLVISEAQIGEGMLILENAMASIFEEGERVTATTGQHEMADKGHSRMEQSAG